MKRKALAGGTSAKVTGHTLEVDPDCDLSVSDLEKAIYACLAQADLAVEAMNAKMSVEQLVAAKEAETKAKADVTASKVVETETGDVVAPAALKHPVIDPVVPAKTVVASAGGVKGPSGDGSAPSSKHTRRRKPETLGTRDG